MTGEFSSRPRRRGKQCVCQSESETMCIDAVTKRTNERSKRSHDDDIRWGRCTRNTDFMKLTNVSDARGLRCVSSAARRGSAQLLALWKYERTAVDPTESNVLQWRSAGADARSSTDIYISMRTPGIN